MLTYFVFIIAGFTGLLILFIINTKYRFLSHINQYLQIIIGIVSLRFFLYGISPVINDQINKPVIFLLNATGPITVPCIYLYFKALLDVNNTLSKNYRHFVFPALLIVVYLLSLLVNPEKSPLLKSSYGTGMVLLGMHYCLKNYFFLRMNIWGIKKEIKSLESHQKIIYSWTLFLFLGFVLIITRFTVLLLVQQFHYEPMEPPASLWLSAIVWIIIYLRLLVTPQILYGFEMISKKIESFNAQDFVLDMLWTMAENQDITNPKDQKLTEKIKPLLKIHIRKIEEFSLFNDFFRNADATIEELAKALNLPSSHVIYVFKYHCKESFADFKKIIRVQDAIRLLKSGFHASHTLESLAVEVGFASYPTFFNSFKSITGKSPQEYISAT